MTPTVIITGASRGIGKVTALELAQRGYNLMLVARNEDHLFAVRDECEKIGAKAVACVLDVTNADAGPTLRDATLDAFGPPWGLVNNAGMAESAPLAKTDEDLLQRHLKLNFLAPMHLMRTIVPRMVENKGGRVINLCSTAALSGYQYVSAYSASKAGLEALSRSFAASLAPRIKVNSIAPALIMFNDGDGAEYRKKALAKSALGIEPGPEVVYQSIRYLMDNPYVTGTCLDLNGGRNLK